MWHDEETLKNMVILNPIQAFIEPCSLLIRKYKSTANDLTVHMSPLHKECQDKLPDDFVDMRDNGIVSDALLQLIFKSAGVSVEMVVRLMIKYSLVVAVHAYDEDKEDKAGSSSSTIIPDVTSYIVPSLLPEELSAPENLQGRM